MSSPRVLTPFTFPSHALELPNRVVLAAMTNKQSHADGTLGDDELEWLVARARGGFGLITTCAMHVSLDGQGWDGELGVFDDALIPGLTRLTSAVHREGKPLLAQLFHGGVRAPSRLTGRQPWSASRFQLEVKGFEEPRAATIEDIERTVEAFGAAAARCAAAGFDGVEIHGAHGYLITQFLGTISNTRTDEWGGSLTNRIRLLRRVLAAVRAATPAGFLVGVRLSPEIAEQGVDFDDALLTARRVAEDGADFVHASLWDSFQPPKKDPDPGKPLTAWYREAIGPEVPLIVTGGVWTVAQADQLLDEGADLVGLARAAIGNPRWPSEAARAGWKPARPPYSPDHLREAALGETLLDYMRQWPGFVTDGQP